MARFSYDEIDWALYTSAAVAWVFVLVVVVPLYLIGIAICELVEVVHWLVAPTSWRKWRESRGR